MFGTAIDGLNQGLIRIQIDLQADTVARQRVCLLVIRVGDRGRVDVVHDWADAIDFQAPHIEANGTAPLGGALNLALTKIEQLTQKMKQTGIRHTRPLLYMITAGQPAGGKEWATAVLRCRSDIQAKKVQLFAIGTSDDVNFEALKETGGAMLKLMGLNFRELFQFISASVASASKMVPGQNPQVTKPQSITIVT